MTADYQPAQHVNRAPKDHDPMFQAGRVLNQLAGPRLPFDLHHSPRVALPPGLETLQQRLDGIHTRLADRRYTERLVHQAIEQPPSRLLRLYRQSLEAQPEDITFKAFLGGSK